VPDPAGGPQDVEGDADAVGEHLGAVGAQGRRQPTRTEP
jgi:hypothetical protein